MEYKYEDNTKLRIVLLLNNITNTKIIKYNKEISNQIPQEILFSDNCIPHITLISGKLNNSNNFDIISKIITDNINEKIKNKIIINFDKFYFSEDEKWLFASIEKNAIIADLIASLRYELRNYMTISDARHLHVTVAKSDILCNKKELINNFILPNKFTPKNIAIGLSGDNGVLLNIIKKYKIN